MFRFTIRELVLATAVVAMGAAWWADRRARDWEVREKIDRIYADFQAATLNRP